jgi:Soluble lytic murein transglycosylase and related regulatory proteins (some contain LysM/invasin domains)
MEEYEEMIVRAGIPVDENDELVQKYVRIFSGPSKWTLQLSLERCAGYREMVLGILREYRLPEELIYLPVIESYYNVNDLSSAGALGMWQLMPERAKALGLKIDCWVDERKDPEKSTRAAAKYLKQLYALFGDWPMALSAYNRGEYGLMRDMKNANCGTLVEARQKKALPLETERYVPRFMACVIIARDPEKYGLKPAETKPFRYDKVRIDRTTDLKLAASCAGTSIGRIRELNPALKAWCTPHGQTGYELLLPEGTAREFLKNIAAVKDPNPLPGHLKYKVGRGESIEMIASRFATTAASIRKDNRLNETVQVNENQMLVVRPGKEYFEIRTQ